MNTVDKTINLELFDHKIINIDLMDYDSIERMIGDHLSGTWEIDIHYREGGRKIYFNETISGINFSVSQGVISMSELKDSITKIMKERM